MLLTEPPGSERAFFEIAATLIPLLLFGGVLIERARPPALRDWKREHESLALVLAAFGAVAILAEALAIEAVVTGQALAPTRVLVALVLVAGMTLAVAAISWPWLSRLRQSGRGSYGLIAPLSAVVLLAAALGAFGVLVDGTDIAAQKERFDAYEKALKANLAEQDAVRRRLDSLSLEMSRLDGRLAIATGHRDEVAVSALTVEIDGLDLQIELAGERESRLFREGVNLEREARGDDPLPIHRRRSGGQGRTRP